MFAQPELFLYKLLELFKPLRFKQLFLNLKKYRQKVKLEY